MELATKSSKLFEAQPPNEKNNAAEICTFELSISECSGGVLSANFRQPFDLTVDMAIALKVKKAAGMSSSNLCQGRLPWWTRTPTTVLKNCEGSKCSGGHTDHTKFDFFMPAGASTEQSLSEPQLASVPPTPSAFIDRS